MGALSMNDQSKMSALTTSDFFGEPISSLVPGFGKSPADLQDGQQIDPSGQRAAPVSRSRKLAKGLEPMTQGTCGRTYFASSVQSGPLSLWENRLRERLATLGSTESALIWKASATPAGRSKSRLVQSTLHKNGPGTGGSQWRAPTAGETRGGSYADPEKALARLTSGHAINLEDQVVMAQWATATARDWRSDRSQKTSEDIYGAKGRPLNRQILEASGWTPNGSTAQTGKRGAPNPVFACWLMGWSDGLIYGVLQAIRLSRKSRRKS
jgi:hypothetical protein